MATASTVENDVYKRFGLDWAKFPALITPSAHSNDVELFCAKQSMAAYGVYPSAPYAPEHDYIPSQNREAIKSEKFSVGRMFGDETGSLPGSFEGEQGYRIVSSDRAGALLVWKSDHLIVAFRGTANWQDWIHNLNGETIRADLSEFNDKLTLHKGFIGLTENIAPAVEELIFEFLKMRGERGSAPILTFCGHSLGGTLALNFVARISHLRPFFRLSRRHHTNDAPFRIGATYTFGTPRIARGPVWQYIHRPHYRLILRGDPVPRTPPLLTDDYEATYLEKSSLPASQPESAFGKIRKAALSKLSPPFDLKAHDIECYIESIQRKIST